MFHTNNIRFELEGTQSSFAKRVMKKSVICAKTCSDRRAISLFEFATEHIGFFLFHHHIKLLRIKNIIHFRLTLSVVTSIAFKPSEDIVMLNAPFHASASWLTVKRTRSSRRVQSKQSKLCMNYKTLRENNKRL